jgi:hypothetical protein
MTQRAIFSADEIPTPFVEISARQFYRTMLRPFSRLSISGFFGRQREE